MENFWHTFRKFIKSKNSAVTPLLEGEKMCRKEEACVKCTQSCLKIHGKKEESSPAVTSFFKIMIGLKFSEVLFLPPKFVRSMPELVNQEAILEDSSGCQWEVTISNVDGSLAFQQGWNDFSLAHNLEVGYFLVFQYLMKSHFVVKIFDTSACEKLDLSKRSNRRKRRRDDGDTVEEDSCHTNNRSAMKKQDSSSSLKSGLNVKINEGRNGVNNAEEAPSVSPNLSYGSNMSGRRKAVSKPENIDETYQIIYRDLGSQQEEDRSPVFDLSNFEMWNDKSGGNGINKDARTDGNFTLHVDSSMRSQNEVLVTDKNPVAKDAACLSVPLEASNSKKVEIDNHSKEMNRVVISDNDTCIDKAKDAACLSVPLDASNSKKVEIDNHSKAMNRIVISDKDTCIDKAYGHGSAVKPEVNVESVSDMSNRKFTNCELAEESGKTSSNSEPLSGNDRDSLSQKVGSPINDSCQSAKSKFTRTPPSSVGNQNFQSDETLKVIKVELVENTSDACEQDIIEETHGQSSKVKDQHHQSSDKIVERNNEVDSEMRIETDDSDGIPSDSSEVPCLVATAGSESFLELPASLPYTSIMGRSKMDRMVVILRDPKRRLWSVIYHETSSYRVLTSGWEAFSKANSVQPEDECIFIIENDSKGIYKVRIVRK